MQDILLLLQAQTGLFLALVTVLGLLIGSFLNVVIHRLPKMMERDWRQQCAQLFEEFPAPEEQQRYSLWQPRSACPHCARPIRAIENIPLLSYLWLKGRCAGCGASISLRYPAVELLTGLLSAAVAWRFGVSAETAAALVLTWTLIALSGIDMDTMLLPDSITLPLLWLGLLLTLWHGGVNADTLFQDPRTAIIGAAAGYLSLWSVYQLFRLATGREGMGYGDFKLLAALGAWLGWQMLPLVVILSAVVGAAVGIALIVFRGRERAIPIPFGPYLAAAGWVAMLWGDKLIAGYWRSFGV